MCWSSARPLGHTAILISHALAEVERLCDRVAVSAGRKAWPSSARSPTWRPALSPASAGELASGLETALAPYYEEALA